MTDKEAIKMLKARIECISRDISGDTSLCGNDCGDCEWLYAQGNLSEQREVLELAVKALEEIKKIKEELQAEIDESLNYLGEIEYLAGLNTAMTIVEKQLGGE